MLRWRPEKNCINKLSMLEQRAEAETSKLKNFICHGFTSTAEIPTREKNKSIFSRAFLLLLIFFRVHPKSVAPCFTQKLLVCTNREKREKKVVADIVRKVRSRAAESVGSEGECRQPQTAAIGCAQFD